jgi:hypothetical protein
MKARKRRKRRTVHRCTCGRCQRHPYSGSAKQHRAINRVLATLDEGNRRRFVGLLACQWGRGGLQSLNRITGLSRNTIRRGRAEVARITRLPAGKVRQSGGGRQRVEKNGPRS